MRKLAAILLWGLLLFNWVGYRLVGSVMQERAERRMEARLDRRQYGEWELFTVRVAVTGLSYYNTSTSFERVDGSVEINGIPYQYVERRLYNDSLELRCIPNGTIQRLRAGGDGFVKLMSDVQLGDPYVICEPIALGEVGFRVMPRAGLFSTTILSRAFGADERPPVAA